MAAGYMAIPLIKTSSVNENYTHFKHADWLLETIVVVTFYKIGLTGLDLEPTVSCLILPVCFTVWLTSGPKL